MVDSSIFHNFRLNALRTVDHETLENVDQWYGLLCIFPYPNSRLQEKATDIAATSTCFPAKLGLMSGGLPNQTMSINNIKRRYCQTPSVRTSVLLFSPLVNQKVSFRRIS